MRDGLQDSCLVLEHFLADVPKVILPTLHCFTIVTESNDGLNHDWSLAQTVPQEEIICQVYISVYQCKDYVLLVTCILIQVHATHSQKCYFTTQKIILARMYVFACNFHFTIIML